MRSHVNHSSKLSTSPEQRLLLACSRTDLGTDVKTRVDDLLNQAIDWTHVVPLAQKARRPARSCITASWL